MKTSKKKTTKGKSKAKSKKIVTPQTVETQTVSETTIIPDIVLEVTETTATSQKQNKTQAMLELLTRENGATLEELATTTGWLVNSVRGALSAYAKKHPEYSLISEKMQGVRTYRLSPNWHD